MVALGQTGAEKLKGQGDFYYKDAQNNLSRVQTAYLGDGARLNTGAEDITKRWAIDPVGRMASAPEIDRDREPSIRPSSSTGPPRDQDPSARMDSFARDLETGGMADYAEMVRKYGGDTAESTSERIREREGREERGQRGRKRGLKDTFLGFFKRGT